MKMRLLSYGIVLGVIGVVIYGGIAHNSQTTYAQASPAMTYEEHESFARADGANHCTNVAPSGFSDYVWISNPTGGGTVRAHIGASMVGLRANIYGKVCPNATYTWVATAYKVDGRIAEHIFYYPQSYIRDFQGTVHYQSVNFNLSGLSDGRHCYDTVVTGTPTSNNLTFVASQSAKWCINIERYRNWAVETRVVPTVGGVSIAGGTARVGDVVEWAHDARNNGPEVIMHAGGIPFRAEMGEGYSSGGRDVGRIPDGSGSGTWHIGAKSDSHTIRAEDIGKRFCRSTTATPRKSDATSTGGTATSTACFTVRSGFELYPEVKIQVGGHGTEYYGSTVGNISLGDALASPHDIKETIYNRGTTGSADRSGGNPVTVSEFIVKSADRQSFIDSLGSLFSGGDSSTPRFALAKWDLNPTDPKVDACNQWLASVAPVVCRDRKYYDQELGRYQTATTPLTEDTSTMDTTTDVTYGDLVCRMVSVGGYSHRRGLDEQNQHRVSVPACMMVAKTPTVQLWGADVRTGANVITGRTTRASGVYGSWAEFAIMANGTVSSASGASLSSGPAGRPAPISATQLTFANISSPYGHFGATFVTPTPEAHFPTDPTKQITSGIIDIATLDDGTYTTTGDITLANPSGQSLSGKRIALRAQGNVTIADNITYGNGPYATAAELPQLVVIAESGNIVIAEGVTRLDAWLIAKNGYVSTCEVPSGVNWTSGLSALVCDKQLTINGPILARNLYLRRTYGDAANPGTPAEILNLRPDVYLYGFSKTRNTGSIRTMYVKELAPRL